MNLIKVISVTLIFLGGSIVYSLSEAAETVVSKSEVQTEVAPETESVAEPKNEVSIIATAEDEKVETIMSESSTGSANTLSNSEGLAEQELEPIQTKMTESQTTDVFTVPFFSQFTDISLPDWRKIGCGIASLAMLIDFYEPGEVTVDQLLVEGISADAYLSSAGWIHAGLIDLSKKYGLNGVSKDMSSLSMTDAFSELKKILAVGPVMVSVHYTFDPKNPIPHLVVVNGVRDGKVYYNDPAESAGGGSISISQFQTAWKKRYIEIRPVNSFSV